MNTTSQWSPGWPPPTVPATNAYSALICFRRRVSQSSRTMHPESVVATRSASGRRNVRAALPAFMHPPPPMSIQTLEDEAYTSDGTTDLQVDGAFFVRAIEGDRPIAGLQRDARPGRVPREPVRHAAGDAPDEVRARPESADVGPHVDRDALQDRHVPAHADHRIGPLEGFLGFGGALDRVRDAGARVHLVQEPH